MTPPPGRLMHALVLCGALSASAAEAGELPSLPPGVLPNSEIVTNVVLVANVDRLYSFSFSIAMDASLSNSLSIAVGTATGEELSPEEADFEWGYDCGKWFYADTASGIVEEWTAPETERVERVLSIGYRDFNPSWNRVRVVKRGIGDVHAEVSQICEFKKFSIIMR